MAVQKTFALNPGADIAEIINIASQSLSSQGYEVHAQVMSPAAATMVVKKDRDGIKDFAGLGVECRINLSIMNGTQLIINIDSEWTNKIIAIALGWFLCWIIFITGIVGAVNQNSLPEKVSSAIMMATTQSGNNGFNNNGYTGV